MRWVQDKKWGIFFADIILETTTDFVHSCPFVDRFESFENQKWRKIRKLGALPKVVFWLLGWQNWKMEAASQDIILVVGMTKSRKWRQITYWLAWKTCTADISSWFQSDVHVYTCTCTAVYPCTRVHMYMYSCTCNMQKSAVFESFLQKSTKIACPKGHVILGQITPLYFFSTRLV